MLITGVKPVNKHTYTQKKKRVLLFPNSLISPLTSLPREFSPNIKRNERDSTLKSVSPPYAFWGGLLKFLLYPFRSFRKTNNELR